MGRGDYNGGSTVIGPGSSWFSYGRGKEKPEKSGPSKARGRQTEAQAREDARKVAIARQKEARKAARQAMLRARKIKRAKKAAQKAALLAQKPKPPA